MDRAPDLDSLMALPLLALVRNARSAEEVSDAATEQGIRIQPGRTESLLRRLTELGLVRMLTGASGPRYVATSLGQRMADSVVGQTPQLATGLEELERLRSDLLATIGHELRTPLTAIRTSVGLLLDTYLEPNEDQRQQLLATIGRSADRMQRLLGDLLDFARLRGGAEIVLAGLDARDVAREVAATIEPLVAAADQTLAVELPDEPIHLLGDRRRLEQALLNLLSNAQRFTPAGGEFRLRLAADDDEVRWTVEDDGPGISRDDQARLFERFFVGVGDRTGQGGGIGLGLPTALAIAQAHGGAIEVQSEPGRGSTFTLVAPRRR